MANFKEAVEKTLQHEAGYVNDPDDAGGETKYGISKRAYPGVDIKKLTEQDAKDIYKHDYWDLVQGDSISSQKVAASIFDFSVNAGVHTAAKLVQLVCGAKPDGKIGLKSVALINEKDEDLFLAQFALAKIARYAHIVEKNPKNRKFFYGWVRRTIA